MNIPDKAYEAVTAALLRASDGINADMIYDHEAEWFAKAAVEAAAPFIAAQALRDLAANLRFIAARSRQDEATGLDQAADIAKAEATTLDPL